MYVITGITKVGEGVTGITKGDEGVTGSALRRVRVRVRCVSEFRIMTSAVAGCTYR